MFDKTRIDWKTEVFELVQIPFLNRCHNVVSDLKARNFFALQYHPNTNMRFYPTQTRSCFQADMQLFLDEHVVSKSSSQHNHNDYSNDFYSGFQKFYDIELKYRNHTFGLHKFILLSRCAKFFLKFDMKSGQIDIEPHVNTQKFSIQILEFVIRYIYTNEISKEFMRTSFKSGKVNNEATFIKFVADFRETAVDKFGLNELKASFETKNYLNSLKDMKINSKDSDERQDVICDFFDNLVNQTLSSKRRVMKYTRNSYAELYDCTIDCNNDQSIKCHKCILVARSDYFRNMLMGSWLESTSARIQLPFDMDLIQIIVDYLYTDEIQMEFVHLNSNSSTSIKSRNEKEIEVLFNLYILSDQLLVERLKNLCEFKLSNLVNLKNVAEIFDFSSEYEADQLKEFCMEFISCNLVTLIDAKQLDHLDMSLLRSLSKFYRSYFPVVESRMITPYEDGLDPSKVDIIPMDVIYDQRFVDGSLNEDDKKRYALKEVTTPSEKNQQFETETTSLDTSVVLADDQEEAKEPSIVHDGLKWEKVKKKVILFFY